MAWMFLAGSRYVSQWLQIGEPMMSAAAFDEGSPLDAFVFFLLIAAGVFVLYRRKIGWSQLLSRNKWIFLYFAYCGFSICWSDDTLVCFKRYVKELGNVVMVLVILTEEYPYEALRAVLRRLTFAIMPLSLLFVRYFPELGRAYAVEGQQMFTGVSLQKNGLGMMCLISGICFSWDLLLRRKKRALWEDGETIINLILIGMIVYLLHMSQSATSLSCMVVAAALFVCGRTRMFTENPERVMAWMVTTAFLVLILDATLDIRSQILALLGRDETLTSRTSIWELVTQMQTNPIVGSGFQSFWTGTRMEELWQEVGAHIIQAHNGYLEQYLNLGYIGVTFVGAILLSGLLSVRRHLISDYPPAMLRLCIIVAAVLYNYTEASFYGLNDMWILLLIACIDIPNEAPICDAVPAD